MNSNIIRDDISLVYIYINGKIIYNHVRELSLIMMHYIEIYNY